ncbi:MAG TPA: hypothetical protein VN688_27970 [Gemmataceae bacterium]|nr:hypothetical protein [Gemmataceae bacterium]
MTAVFDQVYRDVQSWAQAHGIRIRHDKLKREKVGAFDGVSATMNSDYGPEERTYYLAHSLGSIVRWGLSQTTVQEMFDQLRAAKKNRETEPERLERAIERYRAFEVESSEFAVWLLAELGPSSVIASYTNFMRADLEALSEFHRRGHAPVWRDFFSRWNEEVSSGRRRVEPYRPKAIPPFSPVRIENQEILQEQGGQS